MYNAGRNVDLLGFRGFGHRGGRGKEGRRKLSQKGGESGGKGREKEENRDRGGGGGRGNTLWPPKASEKINIGWARPSTAGKMASLGAIMS